MQSPDEPFPTTGQDLAGFWDMVTIQVDHVRSMFGEIQKLKENNWVEVSCRDLNDSFQMYFCCEAKSLSSFEFEMSFLKFLRNVVRLHCVDSHQAIDEFETFQRGVYIVLIAQALEEPEERTSNSTARSSKGRTRPAQQATPRSAKAEEAAKAREEARKKMMQDRKRMAKAKKDDDWGISLQFLLFCQVIEFDYLPAIPEVIEKTEMITNGAIGGEAMPV